MGRLLARKGSRSLGINAIAREAQVDKVLIYRYFGGLNQLYEAFAREGRTFPSLEEMTEGRLGEIRNLPPGGGQSGHTRFRPRHSATSNHEGDDALGIAVANGLD